MKSKWILLAILFPGIASAQVITEIMYDLPTGSDSGREWIEVYNNTSAPLKLSDVRIFENATNHKITSVSGGDTLSPNSYAVVASNPANFKLDWPSFSGHLFKSSFSLSNSGETIALHNASSTVLDTVSYQSSQGGAGDGNSLNRTPGSESFIARSPSPGAPISTATIPPPTSKVAAVSTAKTTTSKKTTAQSSDGTTHTSNIISVRPTEAANEIPVTENVSAAAESSSSGSYVWWAAAVGLALLAAGALVLAKRFSKSEWNIVEESAE